MVALGQSISLPCKGCVACCYGGARIREEYGDHLLGLEIRYDDNGNALTAVDENNLCIYASPGFGCSLYAVQRPADCPAYDCRETRDDPDLAVIAPRNILEAADLIDQRLEER